MHLKAGKIVARIAGLTFAITQDHSRMTCDEWFSRYCPSSSSNLNCKEFDEKVGLAIERD